MKGKPQPAGKPPAFPWRAPPPNIYYLKNLLGYIDHDITKKLAPAYSLVRYVYPPRPKVKVSTAPFIKALRRKMKYKAKKDGSTKSKKKKRYKYHGKKRIKRQLSGSDSFEEARTLDKEIKKIDVFDSSASFRPAPLKYRLTRRTSSSSDYFLTTGIDAVKCKSCDVPLGVALTDSQIKNAKFKDEHGVQFITSNRSLNKQSKTLNMTTKKKVKK